MASVAKDTLLSQLAVSLEQSSQDPIVITSTVRNNGTSPVTILTWNSPLDPLALQLGLLSITRHGESQPLDFPTIKISRKLPPEADSLITIEPGKSSSQDIELREIIVPREKLFAKGGKANILCQGQWTAVWPCRKESMEAELSEMGVGKAALTGPFQSASLEVSSKS